MNLKDIFTKGQGYPLNFFHGEVQEIKEIYELPEGYFLLGKTSEEWELLWGVNVLEDLQKGIEKIKSNTGDINFIFRYAGNLNDVLDKKELINKNWRYKSKCMNNLLFM